MFLILKRCSKILLLHVLKCYLKVYMGEGYPMHQKNCILLKITGYFLIFSSHPENIFLLSGSSKWLAHHLWGGTSRKVGVLNYFEGDKVNSSSMLKKKVRKKFSKNIFLNKIWKKKFLQFEEYVWHSSLLLTFKQLMPLLNEMNFNKHAGCVQFVLFF